MKIEKMEASRICVSVGGRDLATAVVIARQVASQADVIEIRLDGIANPSLPVFFSSLRCPLLFTNRPTWEGWQHSGSVEERVGLLVEAVSAGAAYVDLELLAPTASLRRLREAVAGTSTRLILSRHDFSATPPLADLLDWVKQMRECGADIGKVVTTAHDHHDVLRVLHLQEDCAALGLPLTAFCMGRIGLISRLATIELGGFMTYCAADGAGTTAPGQITVSEFRKVCKLLHLRSSGESSREDLVDG